MPDAAAPSPTAEDDRDILVTAEARRAYEENWVSVKTGDGRTYYYHQITRDTRWVKPDAETGARMEARRMLRDQETSRRQAERLAEIAAAEEEAGRRARETEEASRRTRQVVDAWSLAAGWKPGKKKALHGKDPRSVLVQLLNSVSAQIPSIADKLTGCLPTEKLAVAEWGAVKRAYLKVVRQIHPDKTGGADTEFRAVANDVYTVLTGVYGAINEGEGTG